MADPKSPAIPHPIAELGSLTNVAQAMKLRLDNMTTYVMALNVSVAAIAPSYTLPVASQLTLGGVKIDGTSITISAGVISTAGAAITPATTAPLMDQSLASAGSSTHYARGDHAHPTDLSRYSVSNPANYAPKPYVDGAVIIAETQTAAIAAARVWFGV